MTDDWTWFFRSGEGRANILRDEVASLGDQLTSANATSYRLSSQLATLQGSLESRLNALSAAFDAYVELGDVREQLAAYPDTSAVRRDVLVAIEALSAGRDAEPIDPREQDYWLPYAVNAVIAIAAGRVDPAAEQTAAGLDPDADWFIVALSGVLGHGASVAERVAPLLVCDGVLSPAQVALWTAAYAGMYGSVLDRIGASWSANLANLSGGVDRAEWTGWVRGQAAGGGSAGLAWLRQQTATDRPAPPTGEPTSEAVAQPDSSGSRDGLRLLVMKLVEQGYGGEAGLLTRARQLRQRIEKPAAALADEVPDRPGTRTDEPDLNVSLLDQLRSAFLATAPGTRDHRILTGWLRPGLEAAVEGLRADVAASRGSELQARGGGREVAVTASGPDAAQLAAAEQSIAAGYDQSARPARIAAIIGGVLLVGALVLALTGRGVAGFLTLVLAGAVGVYAGLQARARSVSRAAGAEQRAELVADIAELRERAAAGESRLLAVKQESAGIADEVLRQLAGHDPAGPGGVVGVVGSQAPAGGDLGASGSSAGSATGAGSEPAGAAGSWPENSSIRP